MDARTRIELAQALRRQRATVLKGFFGAERDLLAISEDREAELAERAQEEVAARVLAGLDDRSLREVQDIHAALQRLIDGTYGLCIDCGDTVPPARLRAVPTAERCIDCAHAAETAGAGPEEADEAPGRGHLPPDLEPLLDREVEELLRDAVRQDGRIDLDELRIVCRHGVVHLAGAVPSADEHRMLVKLITDVAGCDDVVDRVQIDPLLWERGDHRRPQQQDSTDPSPFEPLGTEDVVRSAEDGLDYVPPDRPPSDER
jgi:DnaK suppressor protein